MKTSVIRRSHLRIKQRLALERTHEAENLFISFACRCAQPDRVHGMVVGSSSHGGAGEHMAANDVTHAEQLTRILDQSQQIAIDIIKQDLATLGWGVITVVPGILALADKLQTLKDGTILAHFDEFYAASILSFLAAIFVTMIAYWSTNKKLNAPQGNRQTILKLAAIASNAASKG